MREKESVDARREAARSGLTSPGRSGHTDELIRTYLAGIAYAEARTPPARVVDEPPQPVDAPAPLTGQRAG